MAGSITYPDVTGPRKNGTVITVGVGDIVTGYTEADRLVTGSVIATHSYYPTLTIDGITGYGDEIVSGRFTLHLSKVLTHVRMSVSVGQR